MLVEFDDFATHYEVAFKTDSGLGAQDRLAGVARLGAQLFLDAQELVVLGEAVRARQRAGLDLPAVGGDGEVGDGRVLGLARAVATSRRCSRRGAPSDGVQRLRQRADLVDLDQDRVGQALP